MHLIVTEKHTAGKQIAGILSGGAASTTRVKGQTIYECGKNRCLGLAGHIVEVDFPEEYNDWQAIPPSELTTVETETRASKPGLVAALRVLARDANRVTIATDYDREDVLDLARGEARVVGIHLLAGKAEGVVDPGLLEQAHEVVTDCHRPVPRESYRSFTCEPLPQVVQ